MNSKIKLQLSSMMFLEFFIWGGWFVTMGTFLSQSFNASGFQLATAYETQSIGAIIAPFIIGLIADRYFSAQKILGFLHLVGALLLYLAGSSNSFISFYPFILMYMILYMPTLALVNSVAFRQMKDPSKEFPPIRVFGTVGWIISGLIIGYLGWESQKLLENTFYVTASASLILGIFSFTLPNTPPTADKGDYSISKILGLDALSLLKDKKYLIFFISSILICIPLAFYYQHANQFLNEIGMPKAAAVMTLGQISEALFILLLPIFLKRYGIKTTLIVGMLAWVLRYLLFAYGDVGQGTWMLIIGVILHGICYDFFFVSGQIYTDFKAGEQFKSSAQGLITLATYGLGMLIGFRIAGNITDLYATSSGHDWTQIWMLPSGFALFVLIFFIITFRDEKIKLENE
ncbi:MAG: MFS transporter [Flavobacteriaceae bacterium TMED116]|nr:MAG: MFS transporter [Flavobacteriaceae bacterium TMED116]|tara:strand:+ start:1864 stop:3072 length:1209 start_codon:yes stop_codon:yes gene_type:complete